jgi:uncharacterized linocin/CFP29 family protein
MDILKRNLAPVTDEAWNIIQKEAIRYFKSFLSARRILNVTKPHGWEFAAVALGRLEIPDNQTNDIHYGLRKSIPLIEVRIPFNLNIWDLDDITRGAKAVDLDNMEKAARKMAKFEDDIIFNGLKTAHIPGLQHSSGHKTVAYPAKEEEIPEILAQCVNTLRASSVNGPYNLLLGTEKWRKLTTCAQGYPLRHRIEEILGGEIIVSQNIADAVLVPVNPEDLILTMGNDITIGYETCDHETVTLYFTESFTFQVISPEEFVFLS